MFVGRWRRRRRRRLRRLPRHAVQARLQRRPLLNRLLRTLLRLPGVSGLYQASIAAGQAMPPEPPAPLGDMSPRTLRIYRDLQSALKNRKH